MDGEKFLKKYNINVEDFLNTGLTWELLNEIEEKYIREQKELKRCL